MFRISKLLRISSTSRCRHSSLKVMSTRNFSEYDNFKRLAPSDEALKQLQYVDLSSFNDSLSEHEVYSVVDVLSDSDDPFDPDDLVGIMNGPVEVKNESHAVVDDSVPAAHSPIKAVCSAASSVLPLKLDTATKYHLKREVKKEESKERHEAKLSLNTLQATNMSPTTSTPHTAVSGKRLSISPRPKLYPKLASSPMGLFVPILLSPNSSPTSEFKRPKVSFDTQSRTFHTNAAIQNEMNASAFAMKTKMPSLPNPTIQLATQRPLLPKDHDSSLKSEEKVVKPIILSAEQERVLQLALQRKSIFFTGSAGTGKSVLLKAIIKQLKHKLGPGKVAVTASTGLAACNIGGITVHSFAGIGLGNGDFDNLLKNVKRNRKAINRWCETAVLVVDEVSMIDGQLLDKLDGIARAVRKKHRHLPFGGIQLIICGDFFQLPPVKKAKINPDGSEVRDETIFAFESMTWDTTLHSKIVLKEVFRQKGDQKFVDMLNEMREGYVSGETEREFMRLARPLQSQAGIVPTELYATRFEVDRANNFKLSRLPGTAQCYEARDGGSLPPLARAQMLTNFLAPQKLFLKEKAQVMCIKNFDSQLVNGSLGQVIKFVDRDTYMCEDIMREKPDLTLEQLKRELNKKKMKVKLAKNNPDADEETLERLSQSLLGEEKPSGSIDADLSMSMPEERPLQDHVFDFFYEARTENSGVNDESELPDDSQVLYDPNLSTSEQLDRAFKENTARKLEFIKQLEQSSKNQRYPLVRFLNPDGVTTRDIVVEPEIWEIKDDKTDQVLVSRVQLPLMLAWALSIHKSQGQTLQKVKIDLSRTFENGQAYVALSRAVSRDGLQVMNFRKEKVRAHMDVIQFYNTLTALHKDDDKEF